MIIIIITGGYLLSKIHCDRRLDRLARQAWSVADERICVAATAALTSRCKSCLKQYQASRHKLGLSCSQNSSEFCVFAALCSSLKFLMHADPWHIFRCMIHACC